MINQLHETVVFKAVNKSNCELEPLFLGSVKELREVKGWKVHFSFGFFAAKWSELLGGKIDTGNSTSEHKHQFTQILRATAPSTHRMTATIFSDADTYPTPGN